MSVFNTEDLKIEINTIIEDPKTPMEGANESSQDSSSKSILKSPSISFKESDFKKEFLDVSQSKNYTPQSSFIARPHTLEDFVQREEISGACDLKSTFTLDDLTEDEDIWIIDIPRTIDPLQLKDQVLQLGHETKFKIGEDRYCAINNESKFSLTCVFSKKHKTKKYKAVNIKTAGAMSIRRKLSGISKKKLEYEKTEAVPYPKNIKIRHPFFGVQVNSSTVKTKRHC
ncbi:uncharacterized protein LOC131664276 [Phymastichus coffea]|uniref:uncharacterized protein LOC131664276 n=1 Tax=Phymastichus coffea TaxID=108790 RepID=UPI00273C4B53|nr:uncharacterized protein LOC131664276 [Phymastichus coffea]